MGFSAEKNGGCWSAVQFQTFRFFAYAARSPFFGMKKKHRSSATLVNSVLVIVLCAPHWFTNSKNGRTLTRCSSIAPWLRQSGAKNSIFPYFFSLEFVRITSHGRSSSTSGWFRYFGLSLCAVSQFEFCGKSEVVPRYVSHSITAQGSSLYVQRLSTAPHNSVSSSESFSSCCAKGPPP